MSTASKIAPFSSGVSFAALSCVPFIVLARTSSTKGAPKKTRRSALAYVKLPAKPADAPAADMRIDNGRNAGCELVFLKRERQRLAQPISAPLYETREELPSIDAEPILPRRTIFQLPHDREGLLAVPLSTLVMHSHERVNWRFLAERGVNAEDLLFNRQWEEDLKPAVLTRLEATWQDLLDAGLRKEHVVSRMAPLEFWCINFAVDELFFHKVHFGEDDLRDMEWHPVHFRSLLGCEVWLTGPDGAVELRPAAVRRLHM